MTMPSNQHEQADPQLEALLDEALSAESVPGGIPEGLAQRIIDKTADSLPTADAATPAADAGSADRHPGIIARIGPARVRALAAAVVAAASIGLVLVSMLIVRDARHKARVDTDIETLARYVPPADAMDEELALLDMQIQLALNDVAYVGQDDLLDSELIDLESDVGTSGAGSLF